MYLDSINSQLESSVKSMLEVSESTLKCLHDDSVTEEEVKIAIQNCRCCVDGNKGIKASFNSAQLLGGSNAIDLHALKYCIYYGNDINTNDLSERKGLEFTTSIPSWATGFVDNVSVDRFHWLA